MNIFGWIGSFFGILFENLVYRPQLNLLEFYFRTTGDIGFAIILVGISVNLLLWPLVLSNYITSYKMKVLAPEIKKIQDKFKLKNPTPQENLENSQKMTAEIREFNKKHKVNNAVMFQILFLQLFFGSGLFYIISDIAKMDGKLSGLYQFLFQNPTTNFPKTAFGFLQIDQVVSGYIWLPFLIFATSVIYGYYSFKMSPQIKLPLFARIETERQEDLKITKEKDEAEKKFAKHQEFISKKDTKNQNLLTDSGEKNSKIEEKDEKDEMPIFDVAAFQQTQTWSMILLAPIMSFFFNMSFSTGLNIYFLALNIFNLARQIVITQFYHDHINLLATTIYEQIKSENAENSENN